MGAGGGGWRGRGSEGGGGGFAGAGGAAPRQRPSIGRVYVLENASSNKVKAVFIRTGISDGSFTELVSGDIQPGQLVVTSAVLPGAQRAAASAPPGFGGPGGFGAGGGGRGGGGFGGAGGGGGRR